jgi:hypothetical protein
MSRFNLRRVLLAAGVLVAAVAGGALISSTPALALGPSNDNFAAAATLVGPSGQYTPSLNNSSATAEPGESNHWPTAVGQHSVWFRWTALATADATFRTQGSKFDTVLAVYRQDGSGLGGLTQMDNDDDTTFFDGTDRQSQVSFASFGGVTYYIAVDSFTFGTGDVRLTWTANDDFHAAQQLTGPPAVGNSIVGLINEGTSAEIQESAHAADPAQHSVWFTWTAPRTGTATFQTTLDNFDTQIAVYTGNNVGALNLVVENDNTPNGRQAKVTFAATAGTTYKIVVDGHADERGRTALQYSLV